jgi:hypothetical protein
MSRHTVITTISNAHYERLFAEVSQSSERVIHETFDGDEEPTRIWLTADGNLMSKMPSEPYEKLIKPYTAVMQDMAGRGGTSGHRWTLIQRFVERGMRNEVAIELAHKIYKVLPRHIRVSDAAVDALFEHHANGGEAVKTFVIDDKGEFTVRCA